jgi:O-antigen/teichoic acid export membrane protein
LGALWVYAVSIFSSVAILYFTGVLQARQKFLPIALKDVGIALSKVVLAVVLVVALSYSVLGVLWAESLSAFGAAIGLALYVRARHSAGLPDAPIDESLSRSELRSSLLRLVVPVIVMSLITGLFTSVDLGLARHHLSEVEAGRYAAGASLGRVALYLSGSLGAIVFPRVLLNLEIKKSSRVDVLSAVSVTAVCSSTMSIAATLFGDSIVSLFFGSAYQGGGAILGTISWAMTAIAVALVIFNYLLATERFWFILPSTIVLGATYFSISVLWHRTGMEIAMSVAFGGLGMLVVAIISILGSTFTRRDDSVPKMRLESRA